MWSVSQPEVAPFAAGRGGGVHRWWVCRTSSCPALVRSGHWRRVVASGRRLLMRYHRHLLSPRSLFEDAECLYHTRIDAAICAFLYMTLIVALYALDV
ncbi:hypothetical protein MRX96_015734 [Rhipicephalus microplus]